MKTIILTEKPSVAVDFVKSLTGPFQKHDGYYESNEFVITWAIGHLLTPYDPDDYDKKYKKWIIEDLPIAPEKILYKTIPSTKKQFFTIKKLFKENRFKGMIVATDAGREGELIARLILNELKIKIPTLRFFTSEALTKEVILKNLKNAKPLSSFDRLFRAGELRQVADWLVGMNLSRAVTIKLGDLFSIGRVQTAVLALICERKKEIDQFESKPYFELTSEFEFSNSKVKVYWFDPQKKEEKRKKNQRDDFLKILEVVNNQKAKVLKFDSQSKKHSPDGLFSLTDLQRKANIQLGFSAQKTLDLAQELYEKYKVISYPRTESKVLGESSLDLATQIVEKLKQDYPDLFEKYKREKLSLKNKALFNDQLLTDHHGLIPLKSFPFDPSSDLFKIYDLILRKFVSNFHGDFLFQDMHLELLCLDHHFEAQSRNVTDWGFKEVLNEKTKEEIFQALKIGDEGKLINSKVLDLKTLPPAHYTEASLLYDMTHPSRLVEENELKKIFKTEIGIGTQSTRANIIETLIKRNYILRDKKKLMASSKGEFLINKLKNSEIGSRMTLVKETAKWEIILNGISSGESPQSKGDDFLKDINDYISKFVGEWKGLEFEVKKADFKKTFKKAKKSKFSFKKIGKCPLCNEDVIIYEKSYSCSGWKSGCKFVIWKEIAGKKIDVDLAKSLLIDRKTPVLDGFMSKNGKAFSAKLKIEQIGKTVFDFEQ